MEGIQYAAQGHNGPGTPQHMRVDAEYETHQISYTINGIRENLNITVSEIPKLQQQIEDNNLVNADLLTLEIADAMKRGGTRRNADQSPQIQAQRKEIERNVAERQHMLKTTVVIIKHLQKNLETLWLQILQSLEDILDVVINTELVVWRLQQQLHANGRPIESSLDAIQQWCEDLCELMWCAIGQIHEMKRFWTHSSDQLRSAVNPLDTLKTHESTLEKMLRNLMKSAFVIEKQPPQVIKIKSKFPATVRLLLGSKLNIMSEVKVKIVSENQIHNLLYQHSTWDGLVECGVLVNDSTALNNDPTTKTLRGKFKSLQLRKFSRPTRDRGVVVVTDHKVAMVFQCSLNVGNTVFALMAVSLPIVVTVHSSQEAAAWATITWHNAFAQSPRPGAVFVVPDEVLWSALMDTLNTKFYSACSMLLKPDQLRYLETKLFRGQPVAPTTTVTWIQLVRVPLPGHAFSFWEWYYNAVKTTKLYLQELWQKNMIIGFISKPDAESLLAGRAQGTFLIRFSDSTCGAVTVCWIEANGQIFSLKPFTTTHLGASGLPDRLLDLDELITLYPDIRKEQLYEFVKSDQVPALSAGYIRWKNKMEIMMSSSLAATPSTNQQNMADVQPLNNIQDLNSYNWYEDIDFTSMLSEAGPSDMDINSVISIIMSENVSNN